MNFMKISASAGAPKSADDFSDMRARYEAFMKERGGTPIWKPSTPAPLPVEPVEPKPTPTAQKMKPEQALKELDKAIKGIPANDIFGIMAEVRAYYGSLFGNITDSEKLDNLNKLIGDTGRLTKYKLDSLPEDKRQRVGSLLNALFLDLREQKAEIMQSATKHSPNLKLKPDPAEKKTDKTKEPRTLTELRSPHFDIGVKFRRLREMQYQKDGLSATEAHEKAQVEWAEVVVALNDLQAEYNFDPDQLKRVKEKITRDMRTDVSLSDAIESAIECFQTEALSTTRQDTYRSKYVGGTGEEFLDYIKYFTEDDADYVTDMIEASSVEVSDKDTINIIELSKKYGELAEAIIQEGNEVLKGHGGSIAPDTLFSDKDRVLILGISNLRVQFGQVTIALSPLLQKYATKEESSTADVKPFLDLLEVFATVERGVEAYASEIIGERDAAVDVHALPGFEGGEEGDGGHIEGMQLDAIKTAPTEGEAELQRREWARSKRLAREQEKTLARIRREGKEYIMRWRATPETAEALKQRMKANKSAFITKHKALEQEGKPILVLKNKVKHAMQTEINRWYYRNFYRDRYYQKSIIPYHTKFMKEVIDIIENSNMSLREQHKLVISLIDIQRKMLQKQFDNLVGEKQDLLVKHINSLMSYVPEKLAINNETLFKEDDKVRLFKAKNPGKLTEEEEREEVLRAIRRNQITPEAVMQDPELAELFGDEVIEEVNKDEPAIAQALSDAPVGDETLSDPDAPTLDEDAIADLKDMDDFDSQIIRKEPEPWDIPDFDDEPEPPSEEEVAPTVPASSVEEVAPTVQAPTVIEPSEEIAPTVKIQPPEPNIPVIPRAKGRVRKTAPAKVEPPTVVEPSEEVEPPATQSKIDPLIAPIRRRRVVTQQPPITEPIIAAPKVERPLTAEEKENKQLKIEQLKNLIETLGVDTHGTDIDTLPIEDIDTLLFNINKFNKVNSPDTEVVNMPKGKKQKVDVDDLPTEIRKLVLEQQKEGLGKKKDKHRVENDEAKELEDEIQGRAIHRQHRQDTESDRDDPSTFFRNLRNFDTDRMEEVSPRSYRPKKRASTNKVEEGKRLPRFLVEV